MVGFAGSLGGAWWNDVRLVKTTPDPVSVPESDFITHPSAFILSQPYPNPFNNHMIVGFEAPHPGFVLVEVRDLMGRQVAKLQDGYVQTGRHNLVWNASDVAAGEYVVVMTDPSGRGEARKVALIK